MTIRYIHVLNLTVGFQVSLILTIPLDSLKYIGSSQSALQSPHAQYMRVFQGFVNRTDTFKITIQ